MAEEHAAPAAEQEKVHILVYSDDATTRQEVLSAVGRRAGAGLPAIVWKETATPDAVLQEAREGDYALLILDGEAPKLGGMGLGKMVHDEVDPDLPFIALIGRPQDEWLGRWSGAEAILPYPINPRDLSGAVSAILEKRLAA